VAGIGGAIAALPAAGQIAPMRLPAQNPQKAIA
jgi:hypothetical protein